MKAEKFFWKKLKDSLKKKKDFAPFRLPLTFKLFFLTNIILYQKIFSPIVLTFDVKLHSISVFPMGILNTQKIPSGVGWAHFLHHKSGNVTIFPLGVLDHLFSEVATVQVLGDYTNDTKFTWNQICRLKLIYFERATRIWKKQPILFDDLALDLKSLHCGVLRIYAL